VVLSSRSPEETEAIGRRVASLVGPGDIVCLFGSLGAGKTTFVRGLHHGMGCRGRVRSPSFMTLLEYPGPLPLYHFDLYRYEAAGIGFLDEFAEWLGGDGVAVVEWADRFTGAAPAPRLEVRFAELPEGRRLTFTADDGEWASRLTRLGDGAGAG
jgi:tRNA threonylcarbamoyladenosine biosynthesis protein TsaE